MGKGGGDNNSKYKCASFSFFRSYWDDHPYEVCGQIGWSVLIASATDIHGGNFDNPANPVAPGGVLYSSLTPAQYVSFINYVDSTQLARFGLRDGRTVPFPHIS